MYEIIHSKRDHISINCQRFYTFKNNGSHQIFLNQKIGKKTIVPMHCKDLKKGTLHAILKQAGIDPQNLS